jgi:hypothetical protein
MRPLGLGAPTAFKFGQAKESKGPIGFGGGGRKTKNTKKSRKSNKTRKSKLKRK